MNDVIRLLPDSVANQIAAGEVIQRPAAVIKELVENAVDAGATDIRIYVKDAGRTLIQVLDNGCGMSAVDARMAFERHATSKISHADDLFRLHTMGFRGEALPSICAIAQIDLRTRRETDQIGTRLLINGSKVESQQPDVCEKGTSISVKNLFFNQPARRKFLKSDNVELSNVMREFERLALVNNRIRLFIDTGTRQLDLRPATLHQRIHDIWKNNLKMQLLPVEVDTQLIKIHGYVSRPEFARRRNALQFLIVNGRNMRHPYFHKAVISCFEGLIASDTQPCYFLKFEVDPSTIDVNIHPTKNEIKFEYENEIWPLLVAGVKASLGKHAAVPSIDFNSDVVPVKPREENDPTPSADLPPDYNPFAMLDDSDFGVPLSVTKFGNNSSFVDSSSFSEQSGRYDNPNIRNWDKLYSDFMTRKRETLPEEDLNPGSTVIPGFPEKPERGVTQMCLQFALKYIIAVTSEGIMLIDQHRAHVKVLFEKYLSLSSSDEKVAQHTVFPEPLELMPEQIVALKEIEPELRRLGFELSHKEDSTWLLAAVPGDLRGIDPKDMVLRILDSVIEDSINYGTEQYPADKLKERIALLMARSGAVTRGRKLSSDEMEKLVAELFALPDPVFTPNGNRIYALLDESSVMRLLG